MVHGLSLIVITRNEEANIEACLKSADFASEMIVVDALSEDATAEIAVRLGARVVSQPWMGYAYAKSLALDLAGGPWVLSLDADERVSKALKEEIFKVLERSKPGITGYFIPRRSLFLGRWMKASGLWPDYQMRLFLKAKARFEDVPVHESAVIEGKAARLFSPIEHFAYASLDMYFEKMLRYARLSSGTIAKKKKKVGMGSVFGHGLAMFLKRYLLKRGFLDGQQGFALALLSAFHDSAKYLYAWEMQKNRYGNHPDA
jgi:glycosyltransferase involved in cell wall biosynthesis